MPAIVDKLTVTKEYDKRVKLTDAQKAEIKDKWTKGMSQRELSRIYNVSRRLISFILFPERLKQNIELRQIRGGSKHYYKKDKHTIAARKHREYKKELLKEGKI